HWVNEIARKIGASEEAVMADVLKQKKDKLYKRQVVNDRQENVDVKPRKVLLEERLAGVVLWKKNKKIIPSFAKTKIAQILEETDENTKSKLVLEVELCYGDCENYDEEMNHLVSELKKETLKEKLGNLTRDIQKMETDDTKDGIKEKLVEFQRVSKELSEL
ncbi:hypothetical protein ACFLY5_00905, partial [Patescibacteria group bacterium]